MADVSDEPIDYKSSDPIMRLRVIHENLMEHELSGTAGNLWKVITELQARRAADAKAVEALRKHVIHVDPMSWHGELMMCELCEGRWTRAGYKTGVGDEPEKHAPKCLAALGARND